MDTLFAYLTCAQEFGWTPEQTDKVDVVLLKDMITALGKIREKERQSLKE